MGQVSSGYRPAYSVSWVLASVSGPHNHSLNGPWQEIFYRVHIYYLLGELRVIYYFFTVIEAYGNQIHLLIHAIL